MRANLSAGVLATLATLGACAPVQLQSLAQSAAMLQTASVRAQPAGPAIASGATIEIGQTIQGRVRAEKEKVEYTLELKGGQQVLAVLRTDPRSQGPLEVRIARKHPVTGELERLAHRENAVDSPVASATEVVAVEEDGTYVVIVEAGDPWERATGAFTVVVKSTAAGRVALDTTVVGRLSAVNERQDYELEVPARAVFQATLAAPHEAKEQTLRLDLFRVHPVTGELDRVEAAHDISSTRPQGVSSDVVVALEAGRYVVRVGPGDPWGNSYGAYRLRVEAVARGALAYAAPVAGTLEASKQSHEYRLDVKTGERFSVELAVPWAGKEHELGATVYAVDATTGEYRRLESVDVAAKTGKPGVTEPVQAKAGATYVVRVQAADVYHRSFGAYEVALRKNN